MNIVHIVAVLAIAQFIFFAIQVGRAREKYDVSPPATSGHEQFDRIYRVQSNTLEQLVCFLPALLIAAYYWPPLIVAAIGAIYLVGRFLYWQSYTNDPKTRGTGFMLTFVPTAILLLASLTGAIFRTAA